MDLFENFEELFIPCRNSDISIILTDDITQYEWNITAVDIQLVQNQSENIYIIYGKLNNIRDVNKNKCFFCFAKQIDEITYSCISDESFCWISTNRDGFEGRVHKITDFSWIIVITNEVIFLKVDERIVSKISRLQSLERTCFMSESFELSDFVECCNIDEEKRIFISMRRGHTKLSFDFSLEELEYERMSDDEDSHEEEEEEEEKIMVYGLPDECIVSSDSGDKQYVIYSESNDYI